MWGHGVFDEADLTLLFIPPLSNSITFEDKDVSYFHDTRNLNYYTPLRYLVLPHTMLMLNISHPTEFKHFVNNTIQKSSRPKAIFINLDLTMGYAYDNYLKCEFLLVSRCIKHPAYLDQISSLVTLS
ncbi:hypothetical protein Fcan01_28250 [Folsomia candida]|uniref:Uncharacterized protein n=1 Tax=Folsomia candida TaxID=158441 RepID=A0A226CX58_FOLCA|nr:hypothetical protein Fcan01_28250 [Folsomia candida]